MLRLWELTLITTIVCSFNLVLAASESSKDREDLILRYVASKQAYSLFAGERTAQERRELRAAYINEASSLDENKLRAALREETTPAKDLKILRMEESNAIHEYTRRTYKFLNKALRADCSDCFPELIQIINRGMDRLPEYSGSVIRFSNLPEKDDKDHQEGKIICYKAYTSTLRIQNGNGRVSSSS